MAIVHIEQLDGDGAETWLAYAKGELRRWDEDGVYGRDRARSHGGLGASLSRVITPASGVTIRLRQVGEFQYIAIRVEGGTYMEFETSGSPVVTQDITSPDFIINNAYKPAVVSVSFDGTTAKASILTGKRQTNASLASRIRKPSQVNLVDEPAAPITSGTKRTDDPSIKHFPSILYESFAPGHPFTGVFRRAWNFGAPTAFHWMRGSWDAQYSRDVGFDIPWGDSNGVKPIRLAVLNNSTVDWPRASGKATITHPDFGSRVFAIYVDAFDQFFAFPVSQITEINGVIQNVDTKYVKQAPLVFPDWGPAPGGLFRKSERFTDFIQTEGTTGTIEFPEYDWKVHPDGLKACAVVFERQAADYDATYFAGAPFTEAKFNTFRDGDLTQGTSAGVDARHEIVFQDSDLPEHYYIGTGLLEVSLALALTGPNPEDFTLSGTVAEIRRPTTSPYCTFLAGYTHYDIPADETVAFKDRTYVADRGDLVVLDIERYWRAADGLVYSFFSVKNLTKNTEVSTWNGGSTDLTGTLAVASQVINYDMASLSFAFNTPQWEVNGRRPPGPPLVDPIPYLTYHPATMVVTFNKARTTLFPDTMPDDIKAIITAQNEVPGRDVLSAIGGVWTYLPLNDVRGWDSVSPDNLPGVRDYYVDPVYKVTGAPAPSVTLQNWLEHGLNAFSVASFQFLLFTTIPRFSWFAYADEIVNRIGMAPRSTFFVHPNGTWAFFDQHRIYNPYGVPGNFYPGYDILGDFLSNPEAKLEHVIYDAVHLQTSKGSLDTSFIELYNKAVQTGIDADSLTDTFDKITKDDIKAEITKQSIPFGGSGGTRLQLTVAYGSEDPWYYVEDGITGPIFTDAVPDNSGGGLIDLTVGNFFYSAPGATTDDRGYDAPSIQNTPVIFSSVVLIT